VALGVEVVGLVEKLLAVRLVHFETAVGMTDAAGSAGEEQLRIALADRVPVEAELQGRGATINGEYEFLGGAQRGLADGISRVVTFPKRSRRRYFRVGTGGWITDK
jgi:hypothetical protein